jgi:hypothetical protein
MLLNLKHYFVFVFADAKGEVREDLANFPRSLFLMHQWFTSSPQLAFLLISSWEGAGVVAPCTDPHCAHFILSPCVSSESSSSNSSSRSSSTTTHPPCRTLRFRAQVIFALRYGLIYFPNQHNRVKIALKRCELPNAHFV